MRKIFAFLLAIMIVMSLSISAYAVTPTLKIPSIKIPDISDNIEVKLPQTTWDNYFKENPFRIDFSKIDLSGIFNK
jgi:hypothetical protein